MNKFKKSMPWSIAAFVITFIIYLLTVAPDVTFTDAGELAGVCTTLGIAHPTGYPLFTILGHLWTKLPLGFTPIYSLNVFAAFLTAVAIFVFFYTSYMVFDYLLNLKPKKKGVVKSQIGRKGNESREMSGEKPGILSSLTENHLFLLSFINSVFFGLSRTVWEQSNGIEVYSLQFLMVNLIIFVFLKAIFMRENNEKMFLLAAFLLGLGFSNHMTTLLVIPAIVFLYFKRVSEPFDFSSQRVRFFFLLFIPLAIGLSLYIYLPLRASMLPDFNWGWVSRSWDKFYYHISGKQYQIWMFTGSEVIGKNLDKFFNTLPNELALLGFIPFFYGLYRCYIASKELLIFFLLLIIGCLAYSLNYGIHDIESYFLTAFIGIAFITGIGLYGFAEKMPKIIPFFLILPLFNIYLNYSETDKSKDYLVSEYTRITMENLQPNAIIISSQWDYLCSAFWYKQKVEGWRNDVVMIEKELLRRTWYIEQLKCWYPKTAITCDKELMSFLEELELFESGREYDPAFIQERYIRSINCFIDKYYGKRPIYVTLEILQNKEDAAIGRGYQKIPEGLAFRLERDEKTYPVSVDKINVDKFMKSFKLKDDHLIGGIVDLTSFNVANIGRYAFVTGQKETARKAYELALRINPENEAAASGLSQMGK